MTSAPCKTTVDHFLDGRLLLEQPASGRHRAGLDAILLAAALPSDAVGRLVDLGSGVGTAGMAAATRAPQLDVVLAERDETVAELARANAIRPENAHLHGRVRVVEVDLMARAKMREALLPRESAEFVITNPPFFAPHEVRASPSDRRAAAHVLEGTLDDWIRVAAATLGPHGRLALIFKGDGLPEILAATSGRFGALEIMPIHPREGEVAHRLVATAIKGSRAKPSILPGLVLHPPGDNSHLPRAEAIMRGRTGLFDDMRTRR